LLATIDAGTPISEVMAFLFVLGLGIGMVNPILLVAVQNSVDFAVMGTSTSAFNTFRQIGGAFGVTALGAIFSARLGSSLAQRVPDAAVLPNATDPKAIHALPPALRSAFEAAFSAALHPVFAVSAVMGFAAFALTWKLPERPLRTHTRAEAAERERQAELAAVADAPAVGT
jgi:hypothetical protein